jgi:DNA-binding CsgD family transcriptional regulator
VKGLTKEEVAAVLDISVETVKLDWRKAKAFLKGRNWSHKVKHKSASTGSGIHN